MGHRIDTKTGRAKLAPRREPYWHKIATRQYLGYRKPAKGEGSWIARYTTTNRKHEYEQIGDAALMEFDQAVKDARAWFMQKEQGFEAGYTVAMAVDDYEAHLKVEKSPRSAKEARQRLDKHLVPVIGKVELAKLNAAQFKRFRDGMVKQSDDPEVVRRSKDSANRVMNMAKAALNLAFRNGMAAMDTAWRRVGTFHDVGQERKLFLTDQQVTDLLKASAGAMRNLIEAAILTGARYGELAGARVRDFDAKHGTLHLSGKTGARTAYLSDRAVAFFRERAKDKLPAAWLLPRDDGEQWNRAHQTRPFREAAKLAKLPREAVFYSLRHYYISKALLAGVQPQVVAENTGTSLRMIEQHYGKFMKEDRRAMFNAVNLPEATVSQS